MMRSICPACGEPSAEGLCDKCALERIKLLSCPGVVEVTVCSVCGAKQVRGRWQITESSAEQLALEEVHARVAVHQDLMDPELDVSLAPKGATRYLAEVRVRGEFRSIQAEASCLIPVRVKLVACDRCSRMAGKYFESTIQIRGSARPPTQWELDECSEMAISMADAGYRRGDQLSFIQDIEEVKGGIDIILGSTQLSRQVARAIFERFGGALQESSKLVGRKDGNDLYRTTLLVRFSRLKKGDLIKHRGVIFEVTRFEGKRIQIESIEGEKKTTLTEEDVEGTEVLANRSDAKKAVIISKDEKVVEIMDPETYRVVFAPRPRNFNLSPGEEADVVRTGDGFIILV